MSLSPAKIVAVPLPWCTSQSTIAARRIKLPRAHRTNRDRDVVEHTKSFATIGEGVMRAAGEVRAVAFSKRDVRRGECAADRVERTAHE